MHPISFLLVVVCSSLGRLGSAQQSLLDNGKTIFEGFGRFRSDMLTWKDSYTNGSSSEFLTMEETLRTAYMTNSTNLEFKAAIVDFTLHPLIKGVTYIMAPVSFIFNTQQLKTVYHKLISTDDITSFETWINTGYRSRTDGLQVTLHPIVFHTIGAAYRIIGCNGYVYRDGGYLQWDSDLANPHSAKSLEVLEYIDQSIRTRMANTPVQSAFERTEMIECTWAYKPTPSWSVWHTYCQIAVYFDYDKLREAGNIYTQLSAISHFDRILSKNLVSASFNGLGEVWTEELRSPLNSSEAIVNVGGILIENDVPIQWNRLYLDVANHVAPTAAGMVAETLYHVIKETRLAPVGYRVVSTTFTQAGPNVYTFARIAFNARQLNRIFNTLHGDETTRIVDLLRDALHLIHGRSLASIEQSY